MKEFTIEQAKDMAEQLNVDFKKVGFTLEEFLEGMNIELEHGTVDPATDVTNDDPLITAKVAMAHLNETALYYNEDIGLEAWEHALDEVKGDTKGKKIQIV
ncbi:MAG TPA: DUF5661 family protein [Clostridia bacterium]|nr:DUF5661 family protein [Clostridia bacterium]